MRSDIRRPPQGARQHVPIEIALVNTMPDSAFEETEQQFTRLLHAGSGGLPLDIHLYTIPDPGRSGVVRQMVGDRYGDLCALYLGTPDAVIVTGAEPRRSDLRDEVYWKSLCELFAWARRSTSSIFLSCLAAHAALLALDGVPRNRLASKHSGVFDQSCHHPGHPLIDNVGPVALPHSRWHDVSSAAVEYRGYTVLLESPEIGWSVATREEDCLVVLVQGHPEYAPTTLLREYRRDVRRFLTGQLGMYPMIPAGYLDAASERELDAFRRSVTTGTPDATRLETFPFQACTEGIVADWQTPVNQLFANWLGEVQRRKANHSVRPVGGAAGRRAGSGAR